MIAALRHCHGRVSGPDGAAKLLGLKASTLAYRMKNFGIEREDLGTYKARLSDFSTKNYSDRERWQSVQSDSSPQ
ncbi:MAG: hypothetical protein HOI95_29315 [Chromatiales bacterium]|nr:hypothetical protein [Chromatiales bacterium]